MRSYEATFILNPQSTEEQENAVIERLSSVITSSSGEVIEVNRWGKRRLCYEIKKFREGNYIIFKFRAAKEQAAEIDRILKIQDEVLKGMVIRNQ